MLFIRRVAVDSRGDQRGQAAATEDVAPDTPDGEPSPIRVQGRHVFLSPHLDDAIGSCGGLMAQLVAAGSEVVIFNMFAAAPTPPFSPAALELHQRWGNPADCLALRRREDQAAAGTLGCAVHFEEVPEALYRRDRRGSWLYPGLRDLFRPPDPEDRALIPRFLRRLSECITDGASMYAPLGIGEHVDHQLAAEVGQCLRQKGRRVLFYQDFPYFLDQRLYTRRLHLLTRGRTFAVACSTAHLAAKTRAFSYYASQLSSLFADGVSLECRMLDAAQFGQPAGHLAEQYFELGGPFRLSWRPRTTFYRVRRWAGATGRQLTSVG